MPTKTRGELPLIIPNVPGYGTPKKVVKSVRLTVDEFFALPEYSCSVPTVGVIRGVQNGSIWMQPDGRFPVKLWRVDKDWRKPRLAQRAKYDPSRWYVSWYEIDMADHGWKYQKSADVEFTSTISREDRRRWAKAAR
jgi:hypothetical protein